MNNQFGYTMKKVFLGGDDDEPYDGGPVNDRDPYDPF